MWDGSAVPLAENLEIASDLLAKCAEAKIIMELEIGVVGGEEDGVVGEMNEKLYSTPEDALATAEALGLGERGRYILAATFGNVHGVYKPGHVKLRPAVLKEIQETVGAKYGKEKPFDLVFHGGSGSALEEIHEAISYGVVKMNVDTDAQYAFSRPVAGHMFAAQPGTALASAHFLPHTPQLLTSVLRLASQPLGTLPSQLPKGAVQEVMVQAELVQAMAATLAPAVHLEAQPPQLLTSLVMFTSQPLA